jgi:hypothetical protein
MSRFAQQNEIPGGSRIASRYRFGYLSSCGGWMDGDSFIPLSELGRRYFSYWRQVIQLILHSGSIASETCGEVCSVVLIRRPHLTSGAVATRHVPVHVLSLIDSSAVSVDLAHSLHNLGPTNNSYIIEPQNSGPLETRRGGHISGEG